jgi:hypothetical protein
MAMAWDSPGGHLGTVEGASVVVSCMGGKGGNVLLNARSANWNPVGRAAELNMNF